MDIAEAGPWMEQQAVNDYDEGIASAGRRLRGESLIPTSMDIAALKAEIKAEVIKELAAKK